MKHLLPLLFLSCSPLFSSAIIWDYGPSSGSYANYYANLSGIMYYADRVVFTSAMVVDGYVHFTNVDPSRPGFEFRIYADNNGKPGAALATFQQAYSGTPSLEFFGTYSIWRAAFTWKTPVRLGPGAYWFGTSTSSYSYQFAVNKPGDGQMAQFSYGAYSGTVAGDQLFQLTGYRDIASAEPATGLLAAAGALLTAARSMRNRRKRAAGGPAKRTPKTGPAAAQQIL